MNLRNRLFSWLSTRLGVGVEAPAFNVSAQPMSVADGITLDKLLRILRDAREGDADELWSLYSHIVGSDTTFIAGKMQRHSPLVAEETSVIMPQNPGPDAAARRDELRAQWANCAGKRVAISHLLDAGMWPVTYARIKWAPVPPATGYYWAMAGLEIVPFWHVTFAADATAPAGIPKVKIFNPDGSWSGRTELPEGPRYVCHRGHLLQSQPDCWGGPMRAVVIWWYFATWARQASANHLEGNNQPKWIGKYPRVDAQRAKKELLAAFNRAVTTTALIIPEDAKIEAVQTLKSDAAEAFENFIKLCQREIAKVVIVQTLTLEAQAQGLGSGQSNVQQDALNGVRRFDAAMLAETIEQQVFRRWLDINGRSGGSVPRLSWAADDDAAAVKADMLGGLKQAGISVAPEGIPKLSALIGLPLMLDGQAAPGVAVAGGAVPMSAASLPSPAVAAAAANDALALAAASDLAEAFGADFAGISRALRDATSPADLQLRLRPVLAGLAPHRSVRALEECLAAAAANGLICGHTAVES